jgi:putative PIN family toxin of toxin-antitoxin system
MKSAKRMPPSAVLDASVLVSAFLFPESVPGRVLKLADRGMFALHLSPILLVETRRSLLRARTRDAYGHSEEDAIAWCAELQEIGSMLLVPLPDIGAVCRDPDDDHVLAAALAGRADTIVTGDKDLLALGQYRAVRILAPRAFLTELVPDARKDD